MSGKISAWQVKLDPSHRAERKSLVYMEANAVVVSLSVLQEPLTVHIVTVSRNDHLITDS